MRNPLQITRVLVIFARLVRNPTQLRLVIELNRALLGVSTDSERRAWVASFLTNPVSANALRQRVALGPVDLDTLGRLPPSTLGGTYAEFIRRHNLQCADLQEQIEPTSDIAYLMAHLYETHDIWHVITGFEPDLAGEAGLLSFTTTQYLSHAAPLLIVAILLNTVLFHLEDLPRVMSAIAEGWRMGQGVSNLVGQDWAAHWSEPVSSWRPSYHANLAA